MGLIGIVQLVYPLGHHTKSTPGIIFIIMKPICTPYVARNFEGQAQISHLISGPVNTRLQLRFLLFSFFELLIREKKKLLTIFFRFE